MTGLFLTISALPAFALSTDNISLPRNTASEPKKNLTEERAGARLGLTRDNASKSGEKKETILNTKIENLKTRGSNEITRRITSLTNIINKISTIKKLTESQKTSLTSNIQAEIESLKALNTKIQADTDIDTLRTDIKSIVTSYRIYLLYLPQTQIIIAADGILNAADKIGELATKLQTRINEAKGAGKDTGSLETTLADMQAKIADAKIQANNAIDEVSQLKPTEYPGNKPSLQSARTKLKDAIKDLNIARQDAQKIIVDLKKLNKNIKLTPETPDSNEGTQSAE